MMSHRFYDLFWLKPPVDLAQEDSKALSQWLGHVDPLYGLAAAIRSEVLSHAKHDRQRD